MRLAALPVVLAIGGCAASVPDYKFADDFEQRYDDVETRLALDPTALRPGDVSKLVLTLSNVGAGFMQLQFPERRQIGLAIYEEGGSLWFTDVDTIKVPRFVGLFNDADINAFLDEVPAPWLVKPRSQAAAIGIRKATTRDEAWQHIHDLGDMRSFSLLEQFVDGDPMQFAERLSQIHL